MCSTWDSHIINIFIFLRNSTPMPMEDTQPPTQPPNLTINLTLSYNLDDDDDDDGALDDDGDDDGGGALDDDDVVCRRQLMDRLEQSVTCQFNPTSQSQQKVFLSLKRSSVLLN